MVEFDEQIADSPLSLLELAQFDLGEARRCLLFQGRNLLLCELDQFASKILSIVRVRDIVRSHDLASSEAALFR
jgi:hypothetical protein